MSSNKNVLILGLLALLTICFLSVWYFGFFSGEKVEIDKCEHTSNLMNLTDKTIEKLDLSSAYNEMKKIDSEFDEVLFKKMIFGLNIVSKINKEDLKNFIVKEVDSINEDKSVNIKELPKKDDSINKDKSATIEELPNKDNSVNKDKSVNIEELPNKDNSVNKDKSVTIEELPKKDNSADKNELPKKDVSVNKDELSKKDNSVKKVDVLFDSTKIDAINSLIEKFRNEFFESTDKLSSYINKESGLFEITFPIKDDKKTIKIDDEKFFHLSKNNEMINSLVERNKKSMENDLVEALIDKEFSIEGKNDVKVSIIEIVFSNFVKFITSNKLIY